jgi:disulfide bond formation protein DsbB
LFVAFAIYGVGIAIYLKPTRAKHRIGLYALWSLLIFVSVRYLSATFRAAPPSVRAIASMTLAMWLLAPWAAWADKHRARCALP